MTKTLVKRPSGEHIENFAFRRFRVWYTAFARRQGMWARTRIVCERGALYGHREMQHHKSTRFETIKIPGIVAK
jgi:hypothetical protein